MSLERETMVGGKQVEGINKGCVLRIVGSSIESILERSRVIGLDSNYQD